MFKKLIYLSILLIILGGCANQGSVEKVEFSVVDALGRDVNFSKLPNKIVIAGKQTPMLANFAYLFSESSEKIVAIENRSQSGDKFLALMDDSINDKFILEKGAGAEQIVPLEPDLVILKTVMKDQIGDQLESVGIPVVYVSFESIDEIYSDLKVIGQLFGEVEKADTIIDFYTSTKSEIDGLIKSNHPSNMLLLQIDQSDGGFTYSAPPESWLQTQMVLELDITPVWVGNGMGGGWNEVNIEQIIGWQPEAIMVINYRGQAASIISSLEEDAVWKNFIEEYQVEISPFPYDFSSWDQPDPRWILGYASIAHRQYKDLINSDYLDALIHNFYTSVFEIDEEIYRNTILPIISGQVK